MDLTRPTAFPDARRSEALAIMLVVATAMLFYAPSLRFGYFYDDFWLLRQGLLDTHRLVLARPAWHMPSWALAQISVDPTFQRAVNLACFGLVAAVGFVLLRPAALRYSVLAVLLAHPWFVYPVTWISQRSDLVWIALVGLALLASRPRAAAAWSVLSLLAKAPFVLHGAVLALRLARAGHRAAGWTVLAATLVVAAAAAWLVLGPQAVHDEGARGGIHTLKDAGLDAAQFGALFLAAGLIKVGESLLLMLVPFPATYGRGIAGAAAIVAYAAGWALAVRELARTGWAQVNGWWLAVGIAAALSFVFVAQLRAIAPAGFFLLGGLLAGLPATAAARAAVALLLAANLGGTVALYRATDTGCYDLDEPRATERCREPADIPSARWERDRGAIVQAIAARIGGPR
jgi:hypothetical protein